MPARASRPSAYAFRCTSSYWIGRYSRSMKMLSMKRPRPSIEIATPAAASLPAKASAVKVDSLIGIEYPRLSEPKQRLLQRRRAEARIVGVRQPPCQNRPAGPVDDRHQIEEAARHRDVGHVGRPHVVRLDNLQAAQQVGVYLVPGRGFAR